jgi:serine/threonine protein kinase
MDGRKAFTICGDPLYFAPEIVSQQGYDFSADLWAYGILVHELFEVSECFSTFPAVGKMHLYDIPGEHGIWICGHRRDFAF